MHYSAKRGIEIACHPSVFLSVRLFVTLVDQDHIGWKSWQLMMKLRKSLSLDNTRPIDSRGQTSPPGEASSGDGEFLIARTIIAQHLRSS